MSELHEEASVRVMDADYYIRVGWTARIAAISSRYESLTALHSLLKRPVRQTFVIWISGAREGDPSVYCLLLAF